MVRITQAMADTMRQIDPLLVGYFRVGDELICPETLNLEAGEGRQKETLFLVKRDDVRSASSEYYEFGVDGIVRSYKDAQLISAQGTSGRDLSKNRVISRVGNHLLLGGQEAWRKKNGEGAHYKIDDEKLELLMAMVVASGADCLGGCSYVKAVANTYEEAWKKSVAQVAPLEVVDFSFDEEMTFELPELNDSYRLIPKSSRLYAGENPEFDVLLQRWRELNYDLENGEFKIDILERLTIDITDGVAGSLLDMVEQMEQRPGDSTLIVEKYKKIYNSDEKKRLYNSCVSLLNEIGEFCTKHQEKYPDQRLSGMVDFRKSQIYYHYFEEPKSRLSTSFPAAFRQLPRYIQSFVEKFNSDPIIKSDPVTQKENSER